VVAMKKKKQVKDVDRELAIQLQVFCQGSDWALLAIDLIRLCRQTGVAVMVSRMAGDKDDTTPGRSCLIALSDCQGADAWLAVAELLKNTFRGKPYQRRGGRKP
jgi:hypothetical protein